MIFFTVPGNPIPKARPRTIRRKGKTITFTPKRTKEYEEKVALFARAAMQGREPLKGHVAVCFRIYRRDWRRVDGSNICKSLEDGMNGIVYVDDSQIVEECWFKNVDRANPRVEVEVEEL